VLSDQDHGLTQRCSRCGELEPVSTFAWHRRDRGQRDTYCRACRAAYKREHYLANRERYIAAATRRKEMLIAERVRFLVEFLRERPCIDCGESDPVVLEFDHLADKEFAISGGCGFADGTTCFGRSTSARSFVQTVIGAELPAVAVSSARL
jgi:hypothetical protein